MTIAMDASAEPFDSDMLSMVERIAKVGHWRLDVSSKRVEWSDAVYRIHGVERDSFELTLETALACYHPADAPDVRRILDDVLVTGRPFTFDLRILTPSRDVRHVFCRGVSERDASGKVAAVFGTVMDISALKLAEKAVRESELRFRLLAESTADVITQLNSEFRREYVSPACVKMFGFTPHEMIGQIPSDTIHPDDRERVQDSARALIRGLTPENRVTNTYRARHKDGHWVWVEAGMSLARHGPDGESSIIICSLRDVTERKCAEAAIEASEARFRALAENTTELIMLGHDDGRRSYISPAASRMLGFTADELMQMSLRDYVHPADLPRLFETTRRLGAGSTEVSIVYRARTKSNDYIWVEGMFRRIEDARPGEPTIVATFRDVSERKAQSEALAEAKTAAEQALMAAESASQAKSDFLASMSHEIRTPLNAIIGYTDLLSDSDGLDARQKKYLDRIKNSGAALLTVVNDILDFSEIEAGQTELDRKPFNLAALIDNTMSIIGGQAAAKRLDLRAEISDGVPADFVGDEARLRQVLLNLLNNAVKFTPAGSVSLSVERQHAAKGEVLVFAVRDTGIGIPDDKRDRLFQRFSQVDGSIRREFGGTGLGLAICKRLVELMGGTIGCEAAEGGGTVFRFDVLLGTAAARSADMLAGTAPTPTRRGGARVLLVEDLEINQELARTVIEAAGHRVDVANDGAEAIAAVKAQQYDVVLMDVQMPGMDGMTATKLIRRLWSDARHVPIVAMTANVMPAQVDQLKAAGMNDHIGKPFDKRELYAVIDRWSDRRTSSVDREAGADELDAEIHEEFIDLIGKEVARKILSDLSKQIGERFCDERLTAGNRRRLAQDAHTLMSAFALAGFRRFSAICTRLENACRENAPLDDVLTDFKFARDRVAVAIDRALQREPA